MLKLGKKEIQLWYTDPREVRDAPLLERYRGLLDEEEERRYRRFVFDHHRHRFLVTRALARSVLGRYESTESAENMAFQRNEFGKPTLVDRAFPGGIHFNISHTDGLIALAVVLDREVGVDVEYLSRRADIHKLAKRYFSPAEYDELMELEGRTLQQRFFELWTLKESYIKACGMGLAIPLEDFSFSLEGRNILISFSPQRDDDPARWRFWQMYPDTDHLLALAITGKDLSGYQVTCRRGIPLETFSEVSCEIFRSS